MSLFEAEQLAAIALENVESSTVNLTTDLLFLVGDRPEVTLHKVQPGENLPAPGETWTDDKGREWYCRTAFPVKNRQGRFLTLAGQQNSMGVA